MARIESNLQQALQLHLLNNQNQNRQVPIQRLITPSVLRFLRPWLPLLSLLPLHLLQANRGNSNIGTYATPGEGNKPATHVDSIRLDRAQNAEAERLVGNKVVDAVASAVAPALRSRTAPAQAAAFPPSFATPGNSNGAPFHFQPYPYPYPYPVHRAPQYPIAASAAALPPPQYGHPPPPPQYGHPPQYPPQYGQPQYPGHPGQEPFFPPPGSLQPHSAGSPGASGRSSYLGWLIAGLVTAGLAVVVGTGVWVYGRKRSRLIAAQKKQLLSPRYPPPSVEPPVQEFGIVGFVPMVDA